MSKWHYIYEDELKFKNSNDPRNGKYLVYEKDTFYKLWKDKIWVKTNDAWDEHEWILDQKHNRMVSDNNELIYIPDPEVGCRLELRDEIIDLEISLKYN